MKEKLWPSIVRMCHPNKLSIQKLIKDIRQKIFKSFVTEIIIQKVNDKSIGAASILWRPLEFYNINAREELNEIDIKSYENLMNTLCSSINNDQL